MMKLRLAIFFVFCSVICNSQNINVRIFSSEKIGTFTFFAKKGKYDCVAGNKLICSIPEGHSVKIVQKRHKIHITSGINTYFIDSLLLIRGNSQDNIFQVRSHIRQFQAREYDNDLYVKTQNNNTLYLINDVNFEKYVAGVVESESGAKAELEYYKAQAILCRTYAGKFYSRHLTENHNLCDAVHCQAYKGRCRYSNKILQAVANTQGLVLVDSTQHLIEAIFSANSGGETCNSETVWHKPISYLRGKPDPYSVGQPGYEWTRTISRKKWEEYLRSKGYQITDSSDLSFEQTNRTKYLYTDNFDSLVELTTVRSDWKLRSTFFCIDSRENEVILYGRGFGHGVGLSQEGAMEMARQGYSFKEILNFYYTNVQLMHISKLKFFQIE